jgi:hypothetical protein
MAGVAEGWTNDYGYVAELAVHDEAWLDTGSGERA